MTCAHANQQMTLEIKSKHPVGSNH